MADGKLSALPEVSVPALEDLLYWVDDPSGTPVSDKCSATRAFGILNHVCQGRLTLTSGTAVTTADVTAATSIYFTPFNGQCVALYDGTRWRMYTFTELTLALGTLTSAKNYDVFLYDNAGTLTLEALAWTNDTTRATALALQDGVYCKTGALTRRYLGTFRTTSTTTTEDSAGGTTTQVGGKRFLWNLYNRMRRRMVVFDGTDSWTYTTATWRAANASAGNRVEYVAGVADVAATATVQALVANNASGNNVAAGVGVDSTSANSAQTFGVGPVIAAASPAVAAYSGSPGVGYHFLQWLEYSQASGTTTWYGDAGLAQFSSGMHAEVWG